MADTLLLLLKISVVFATAGSLLELGLQLKLRETVAGVRNPRFTLLTLLWGPRLSQPSQTRRSHSPPNTSSRTRVRILPKADTI